MKIQHHKHNVCLAHSQCLLFSVSILEVSSLLQMKGLTCGSCRLNNQMR